ncbi:MAG: hypothetical protein SOH81_08735 [Acetobacter sp.]|jgi:hypothetical protein
MDEELRTRDQWCDILQQEARYGGLELPASKVLEDENIRLKRLLADVVMKAIIGKSGDACCEATGGPTDSGDLRPECVHRLCSCESQRCSPWD